LGLNGSITWQWKFEDETDKEKDKKDTILSQLMITGNPEVAVVALGDGDTIIPLTVDKDTGLVTKTDENGDETEVASIRTFFDIAITAAQVD
jgi:hypothetical protein